MLDDLGAEKQTEWVLEQLYSIVNERWQDRRSIVVTTQHPRPGPRVPPAALLRASARELREAVRTAAGSTAATSTSCAGSSSGSSAWRARSRRARSPSDFDPITRLRKQVGSRTVSRLIEICDDPIPIMGPDLRMAAQGA